MSDPAAVTAAVASCLAVAVSLVNVGMTSRSQREQWRRNEERPIVARCLTLSEDALREWEKAPEAKQDPSLDPDPWRTFQEDPKWEKGRQLMEDLRYEAAKLDLLAGSAVRRLTHGLLMTHTNEVFRLLRAKPGQDESSARTRVQEFHSALVEAARQDLGLGLAVPNRSLLGMLIARVSGQ